MEPSSGAWQDRQHSLFLIDGLTSAPSPVLLIVDDESVATAVALAIFDGTAGWKERPARKDRLLRVDGSTIVTLAPAGRAVILAELAASDHWIYLAEVDRLLDTPGGRDFLDQLAVSLGEGGPAAVLASATPDRLPALRAGALRLLGFATILQHRGESSVGGRSFVRTVVAESSDRTDIGWVVAVRYELSAPMDPDRGGGPSQDGRLHLVERLAVVDRPGHPPAGVLVTLAADAFSVSQEDAVYATATAAAGWLVGRPLGAEERVVATRAICYV